jgi:hypothetical protein
MAFELSHTTADGVEHPLSYWRVAETNINAADKRGMVSFLGYHNAQARTDGKQSIASKIYVIDEDAYDEFFAPSEIDPEGNNHIKAAYELASTVLDTDGVSFFDGAEVV